MTIIEPSVLVAELLLGALALLLALFLFFRGWQVRQRAVALWGLGLLALAAEAVAGGSYRSLFLYFDEPTRAGLWKATLYAAGLAHLALLVAATLAALRGRARLWVLAAVLAKSALYAGWVLRHDGYLATALDESVTLLGLLGLQVAAALGGRAAGAAWIVVGAVAAAGALAVQQGAVDPSPLLHQNIAYHLLEMAAVYLLYRGGALLAEEMPVPGGPAGAQRPVEPPDG